MQAIEIKKRITEKGIKQQFLADKLGVTKGLISQWATGKSPVPVKHQINLQALLK